MRTEKCFHIREDHIAHHTLFNRPPPPPPPPPPPKKKKKKLAQVSLFVSQR